MSVVTRSIVKKGRKMSIKMGDKILEYNPNFKLFLRTRCPTHYPPEIQAETTIINFTVTQDGLEDQLLALVVNKERPDLEETKTALIIQNNEFVIKLKELEDTLLKKLAEAEGDLTEDVPLIASLEEAKAVADERSRLKSPRRRSRSTNRAKSIASVPLVALFYSSCSALSTKCMPLCFLLKRFCHCLCPRHRPCAGGKRKVKLSFEPGEACHGKSIGTWIFFQLIPSKKMNGSGVFLDETRANA